MPPGVASDPSALKRATLLRPVRSTHPLDVVWINRTRTSTTRASASPVGSVDSTFPLAHLGTDAADAAGQVPLKPPFSLVRFAPSGPAAPGRCRSRRPPRWLPCVSCAPQFENAFVPGTLARPGMDAQHGAIDRGPSSVLTRSVFDPDQFRSRLLQIALQFEELAAPAPPDHQLTTAPAVASWR